MLIASPTPRTGQSAPLSAEKGECRNHPSISRPFQIVGVHIMELPKTKCGNQYVIVLFTKWPLAFPAPDQKSSRIVRLLVEEIVPLFVVPEALLSDQGTNLLSHLMLDMCQLLGIKKLNTTAYHPQCDGMVERFNCTAREKTSLVLSGTKLFQLLCGHTATRPMS